MSQRNVLIHILAVIAIESGIQGVRNLVVIHIFGSLENALVLMVPQRWDIANHRRAMLRSYKTFGKRWWRSWIGMRINKRAVDVLYLFSINPKVLINIHKYFQIKYHNFVSDLMRYVFNEWNNTHNIHLLWVFLCFTRNNCHLRISTQIFWWFPLGLSILFIIIIFSPFLFSYPSRCRHYLPFFPVSQ